MPSTRVSITTNSSRLLKHTCIYPSKCQDNLNFRATGFGDLDHLSILAMFYSNLICTTVTRYLCRQGSVTVNGESGKTNRKRPAIRPGSAHWRAHTYTHIYRSGRCPYIHGYNSQKCSVISKQDQYWIFDETSHISRIKGEYSVLCRGVERYIVSASVHGRWSLAIARQCLFKHFTGQLGNHSWVPVRGLFELDRYVYMCCDSVRVFVCTF